MHTQTDDANEYDDQRPAVNAADSEQQQPPEQRTSPEEKELVKTLLRRVKRARDHWSGTFRQMRSDMAFARGKQWANMAKDDERYIANIIQRHIAGKVAALYAKNPKAVATRRKTLDFAVWDENPQTLMEAQQMVQQAMMVAQSNPQILNEPRVTQAMALVQDVQEGQQQRQMLDKIGKTLEIVYEHQLGEQQPRFKTSMKQLVRRTITTGVGYVKLGYHRLYQKRPEDVARVTDITEQMSKLRRLIESSNDAEFRENNKAEMAELQQMLEAMQSQEQVLERDGLDIDFPSSTSIIVDPGARQLKGFLGARWVAEEFMLSPDDVKEIYGKDIKDKFTRYSPNKAAGDDEPQFSEQKNTADNPAHEQDKADEDVACVWELYDKTSGLKYCLCDGYPEFLTEPYPPDVQLERFWPFFVVTFNDCEDEANIFPPSDVTLLRPMQEEHNLSRQRVREHRDAARPKHVSSRGKLSDEDKLRLTGSSAHDVVELDGMQPGENIESILQRAPINPIDPNMYEVNSLFDDFLKVGGTQEANMGGVAGATATESSIAENSRMSSVGSNVDDLDDVLTEFAHAASHVLLMEMSEETVREIAGRGAVWPSLSAADIARDLWLSVRAGSSGRPNKAQEIQNFERLAPFMMQVPGLDPNWMLRQIIERLDDRLDVTDAVLAGMPSIVAMNAQAQPSTGDPSTDPNAQGPQGAGNAPGAPQTDANMGPNNAAAGPPDQNPSGAPDNTGL